MYNACVPMSEQNMQPHYILHVNKTNGEVSAAYITAYLSEDFTCLYVPLSVCCKSFSIILLETEGIFSSAFHFGTITTNELKKGTAPVQKVTSEVLENERSAMIGQLVQNAKANWL